MENFDKFNLSSDIKKSLKNLRFTKPTEVQSKTIPFAISKQDILKQKLLCQKEHLRLLSHKVF